MSEQIPTTCFAAGTTGLFFLTFSDIGGILFDPLSIDLTILDGSGSTVGTIDAADRLELGQFVAEWQIPTHQEPGIYALHVDYILDQGSSSFESFTVSFSVLAPACPVPPYPHPCPAPCPVPCPTDTISPVVVIYRKALETYIGFSQRIPVFHEIGRLNENRTTAYFSFPRWNQPAGVRVFVNGNPTTSGFSVNYLKGEIGFNSILSTYDEVQASYTFRWFTDDELDSFISQAIDVFNQYTPHTNFNIFSLEANYARAGVTVANQAAVFAIRRVMLDLIVQEPAKVFGGLERADKLMGQLNAVKQNIEEEITKLYDQKAKGPYLGLTKTVTVPEFTLPGGRSRWFRYLFKGA